MIASVHIADVSVLTSLRVLLKAPTGRSVDGLRHANVALAAPLSASVRPAPDLRRVGLVAFWDDDDALDVFLTEHRVGAKLAGGWHVRLDPLRASGSWPGLPSDVPTSRSVDYDGPVAVLTLGRLRLTQARRFFRTSARAEGRAVDAPGLLWATGLGRPPFVATASLWRTTHALAQYAYGASDPAHPEAIAEQEAKPFHRQSAFIRFRPYRSVGHLDGHNPLAEDWLASLDVVTPGS